MARTVRAANLGLGNELVGPRGRQAASTRFLGSASPVWSRCSRWRALGILRGAFGLLVSLVATSCVSDEPQTLHAGHEVVIAGEPSCASCSVSLRHVASLGDSAGPGVLSLTNFPWSRLVGQLQNGEFVVAGAVGASGVLVFPRKGGAPSRSLGRLGQEPGELSSRIRLAVGKSDELYVMDDGNRRITVLDATGSHLRSFPLPGGRFRDFMPLPDGSVIAHRRPSGPDRESKLDTHPFHVFPTTDLEAATTSLGRYETDAPHLETWLVGARNQGGLWTALSARYVLHGMTPSGEPDVVLVRTAAWFPPLDVDLTSFDLTRLYRELPPFSVLMAFWEDGQGLLWTLSVLPDAQWAPGEYGPTTPSWARATFDTILEVLDVETGVLIAQRRIDDLLGVIDPSHLLFRGSELEPGKILIEVLEPVLLGWSGS